MRAFLFRLIPAVTVGYTSTVTVGYTSTVTVGYTSTVTVGLYLVR